MGRKVSYTQYSMWMNCPQQWKLTYVDKKKPEDISIHLIFGTAIHEAIQQYLDIFFNGAKHKSKVFDMDSVFKEKLLTLFKQDIRTKPSGEKVYPCSQDVLSEFYLDGCAILAYIRKHVKTIFPTSGHELVGCEIPLNLEVASNVHYIGFIDLVIREKRTGRIYIYDLKTSGKGWYYEKKDPKKINQLLLYKHFYSTLFKVKPSDIKVAFIILKRKLNDTNRFDKRVTEFEPAHGVPSVKKALDSFVDFLSCFDEHGEANLEKLEPTPSKSACRFCPFNNNPELCKVAHV